MCANRYELRPTIGGRTQLAIYHTNAGCLLKKRRESRARYTRPKYKRKKGARKEGIGRDGATQFENGRTGYEKHGPCGKNERRSTPRVARQVYLHRAAHSKKSGAEETHTYNPES